MVVEVDLLVTPRNRVVTWTNVNMEMNVFMKPKQRAPMGISMRRTRARVIWFPGVDVLRDLQDLR